MSNQAVVYTSSDCAEGEGLYGGSGGGGSGGYRTRRVAGEASAQEQSLEGSSFVENSLFNGGRVGERLVDAYRLAAPPRLVNGSYAARIRAAGSRAVALDAARLLVVDHDPDSRAYATGSGIRTGSRIAATRLTAADGTDLTSSLDGSQEFAFVPEDVLTVDLGSEGPSGNTLVIETRSLENGPTADSPGIVVQVADGSGGWQTFRRIHAREGFDELAVEGIQANMVRLLFERASTVRFAGRLNLEADAPQIQWADLLSARSSLLGDVSGAIAAADTVSLAVFGPDTLLLGFSVPPPVNTVRTYFLVVEGTPLAPRVVAPPAMASTGAIPTRFALHQNKPNPFSVRTKIQFELPVGAIVRLDVFDLQGRQVLRLTDRYFPPGDHAVEWDKATNAGNPAGPGVYFYRIQAGPFQARKKLVLLP